MEQRLTAVLAADVVGYSKLMGADQAATLAALRVLRSEVFNPCVAGHGGQTIKSMGDGWIVTFASVSDAAKCAIDIQERTLKASTLHLRVGIHLGDIVQEEEDLFGDGVNIASRLEAAATPGDVLISDVVFHSLNGPLASDFHKTQPLKLKNIEREFTTYSWSGGPIASAADSTNADQQNSDDESGKDKEISLCFVGMTLKGGDDESSMLCEGVDEAVRRGIANQTGMTLLDDPEKAAMLVEGTMQVRGDRYRTVVSLKDRTNQKLVKSERFDGVIADLFEAEDELALRICTSLRFSAFSYEASSLDQSDLPIKEQDASAIRVHAGGLLSDLSYSEWVEARTLLEIVLTRDPDDASALAMAGMACTIEPNCGWRSPTDEQRERATEYLSKAVRLNPSSDFAQTMLIYAYLELEENHTRALFAAEKLMATSPHYAQGQMANAATLIYSGEVEEGTNLALKAIEPLKGLRLFSHNAVYLMLGLALSHRHEEVLQWGEMVQHNIKNVPRNLLLMASSAAHLGKDEQARNYAQQLLKCHFDFAIGEMRVWPLKQSGEWEYIVQGWSAAGLPD
ncbi:MAG: adenylate/guanylate cyclase domain-containing protein [Rhizobiaceae bacterium]